MRSLAHFDKQAASIASGVASAMTSNVPSFISTSVAIVHASLQSRYLHLGSPDRQKTRRLQWDEAEKNRAERDRQHENLAMSRNWRTQRERRILTERLAKHHEHVAAREQATDEHDRRPPPLAFDHRRRQKHPLPHEAAARRHAHQRQACQAESNDGNGKRPSDAAKFSDPVVPECFRNKTGRHEHRCLCKSVRDHLRPPAGPRNARAQFVPGIASSERKYEEEVAD